MSAVLPLKPIGTTATSTVITSRFKIKSKIGEGTQGEVYHGIDQVTGQSVAIKVFKSSIDLKKELEAYARVCRAPNVLEVLAYSDKTLVFPLCTGGNLYQALSRSPSSWVGNLPRIRVTAKQIFRTLRGFTETSRVHCDLKPENLLLTTNTVSSQLRIADLCSSRRSGQRTSAPVCSRWYRPPEDFLGYPIACNFDVWSTGCILAELYTQTPLFPGSDDLSTLDLIQKRQGPIPLDLLKAGSRTALYFDTNNYHLKRSSPDPIRSTSEKIREFGFARGHDPIAISYLQDFLGCCLTIDPRRRMSAMQAFDHPFFTHTHAINVCVPPETVLGGKRKFLDLSDAVSHAPIARICLADVLRTGPICLLSHRPLNGQYCANIYEETTEVSPSLHLHFPLHDEASITISNAGLTTCCASFPRPKTSTSSAPRGEKPMKEPPTKQPLQE